MNPYVIVVFSSGTDPAVLNNLEDAAREWARSTGVNVKIRQGERQATDELLVDVLDVILDDLACKSAAVIGNLEQRLHLIQVASMAIQLANVDETVRPHLIAIRNTSTVEDDLSLAARK